MASGEDDRLASRMSLRAVIVALVFAACGPERFAGLEMGPRRTKLHERILANELANGLQVVLLPDARTNLVAVGVHYNVGSSDDPHLAWTVLHGSYPRGIDRPRRRDAEAPRPPREPPAALAVLLPRLAGEPADRPTRASRAELERFRRSAYRPESSTLIVVGKFDPSAMRKEIEALFGGWRGGPRGRFEASPASPRIRSFVAIPAKDATSVELAVAFAPTGMAVRSERVARAVLDEILRDRLRVIREGLGISYGIHAQVDDDSVIIAGGVEPAFAADAARAIMAEVARVREGGPEIDADFARARRRVLARALARPLGPSVRADALARIAIEGRSISDLGVELEEIQKLDLATFRRLAARELRTDLMLAAVRGDGDLELVLRALGATTIEHWKP